MTALEPALHSVRLADIDLAYVEWRPELRGKGPTLLCVHATGFHSRLWDEIAESLSEFHIIAVDQRGHGRSTGGPVSHWRLFGEDLTALVESLELNALIGVGHSMGGHALIDTAAKLADRFRRLVLIDPTVAAPESYANGGDIRWPVDEPHPATKRKNSFRSADEMIARFHERSPYSLFSDQSLRDYCVHGLTPIDGGDEYRLSCSPEMEASVYMTSRTNGDIYKSVDSLTLPVRILRARRSEDQDMWDFTASPTWPGLVGVFQNATEMYLSEHTHFIPMEAPEKVIAAIRDEAAKDGFRADY